MSSLLQEQVVDSHPESESLTTPAHIDAEEPQPAPPAAEEVDETWEEKEDKLDAENIEPETQKYDYKPGDFSSPASPSLEVSAAVCHLSASVHLFQNNGNL